MIVNTIVTAGGTRGVVPMPHAAAQHVSTSGEASRYVEMALARDVRIREIDGDEII
jgi:hypothetical protein